MRNGVLGVNNLNATLQQRLNPHPLDQVERFERIYAVGDKVLQTRNNYDSDKQVFNGDVGIIAGIDPKSRVVSVEFDRRTVDYKPDELDQLDLAYALTIHKAQGSEYPVVVMPLVMGHYMMLDRQMLYTGLTRGKELVILIGEKKAAQVAVNMVRARKRVTWLAERLGVGE
jgi:exodeoxyribonuclease V alpha subunit